MAPAAAYTGAVHRKRKAENQRGDAGATKRFTPVELIRHHEETIVDSTLTTQTSGPSTSWDYDNTSTARTTTVIGATTHDFGAVHCSSSQLGDPSSNDGPGQSGSMSDYTGHMTDLGPSRNSRMLASMVDGCVHSRTIGQAQHHHDANDGQSRLPRDGRTLPADGDDGSDWGWFVYAEEDQLAYLNGGHNCAHW